MVGIALLTLVPGEHGGAETATRGLLRALARGGTLPYRVYLPPGAPGASEGLPAEVVPEYGHARTTPQRLTAMALAAARPGPLRRHLTGADVVHYPLTIRIPPVKAPSVVTLQDVQHLDLPHLFSRAERAFRVLAYHRSARSAQITVVPTAFVRDRVIELLGLQPHRIRVIGYGVDRERFSPTEEEREPFLLYPARPWPHKNHAQLFAAFAQLRRTRPELKLVLTGGGSFGPVPDGVDLRGQVSADELVSLYRRAAALVFPSLYEGFGLPLLEAMACGCPVACSNIPTLVEVCGDAVRTFEPGDPGSIAAAVEALLDDPRPFQARGLERAAACTWERTARAYEDVYRELL